MTIGLLALVGGVSSGQEPAKDQTEPQKPSFQQGLESPAQSENPLGDIARAMQSAGERMDRGLVDDETRQLQTKIVRDLEKLLRQQNSKRPNPQSSPGGTSDAESSTEGTSSSETGGTGAAAGQQRRNDQENAAESQARTEGGLPTDAERKKQRRDLTDAVWGHLPPAVREQLNRSFNDRYLPEYDSLVRRYYEALAERRRTGSSGSTRP